MQKIYQVQYIVEEYRDQRLYLSRKLHFIQESSPSRCFNSLSVTHYIMDYIYPLPDQSATALSISAMCVIKALITGPSKRGCSGSPVLSFSCHRSISSQAHIIIVFNCNTSSFFPPLLAASRLFAPIKSKHCGIQCGDTKSHAILMQDVKLHT